MTAYQGDPDVRYGTLCGIPSLIREPTSPDFALPDRPNPTRISPYLMKPLSLGPLQTRKNNGTLFIRLNFLHDCPDSNIIYQCPRHLHSCPLSLPAAECRTSSTSNPDELLLLVRVRTGPGLKLEEVAVVEVKALV